MSSAAKREPEVVVLSDSDSEEVGVASSSAKRKRPAVIVDSDCEEGGEETEAEIGSTARKEESEGEDELEEESEGGDSSEGGGEGGGAGQRWNEVHITPAKYKDIHPNDVAALEDELVNGVWKAKKLKNKEFGPSVQLEQVPVGWRTKFKEFMELSVERPNFIKEGALVMRRCVGSFDADGTWNPAPHHGFDDFVKKLDSVKEYFHFFKTEELLDMLPEYACYSRSHVQHAMQANNPNRINGVLQMKMNVQLTATNWHLLSLLMWLTNSDLHHSRADISEEAPPPHHFYLSDMDVACRMLPAHEWRDVERLVRARTPREKRNPSFFKCVCGQEKAQKICVAYCITSKILIIIGSDCFGGMQRAGGRHRSMFVTASRVAGLAFNVVYGMHGRWVASHNVLAAFITSAAPRAVTGARVLEIMDRCMVTVDVLVENVRLGHMIKEHGKQSPEFNNFLDKQLVRENLAAYQKAEPLLLNILNKKARRLPTVERLLTCSEATLKKFEHLDQERENAITREELRGVLRHFAPADTLAQVLSGDAWQGVKFTRSAEKNAQAVLATVAG